MKTAPQRLADRFAGSIAEELLVRCGDLALIVSSETVALMPTTWRNMDRILDALTRGLDPAILTRGYGMESRGVTVSYQSQAPVLGLVLPSNSPGVHTLWLPVVPMQIGLVLKPGPQEPWTPWRMTQAFFQAGIPKQAISIYPGGGDVGDLAERDQHADVRQGGQRRLETFLVDAVYLQPAHEDHEQDRGEAPEGVQSREQPERGDG